MEQDAEMEILCTKRLDNLGIVMGTLREFGIIDLIDQKIGNDDQHNISTGEAIAAMVMNGLGFVSRPLSLTPQFFQTKALDILFSRELDPDELNRHRLGRALDDIHTYSTLAIFPSHSTGNFSCEQPSFSKILCMCSRS